MALAILAMHDPRYIKRFREDGIEFRNPLANKIVLAAGSLFAEGAGAAHGAEKERIFEALDPDEETEFRKQFDNIQTGPDEEAFYRETKNGYLIGKYREEKAEITNNIAVAEKIGNAEEIERLAIRLMELDKLINSLAEG
jgi:DNA primase